MHNVARSAAHVIGAAHHHVVESISVDVSHATHHHAASINFLDAAQTFNGRHYIGGRVLSEQNVTDWGFENNASGNTTHNHIIKTIAIYIT